MSEPTTTLVDVLEQLHPNLAIYPRSWADLVADDVLATALYYALAVRRDKKPVRWDSDKLTDGARDKYRAFARKILDLNIPRRPELQADPPTFRFLIDLNKRRIVTGLHRADGVIGQIEPPSEGGAA